MSTSVSPGIDFEEESEEQDVAEELGQGRAAVVSATDWTTETVVSQLSRGNIQLNPRFQRRDAWKRDRKSRFIESLIVGLRIPQIVLAESYKRIKDNNGVKERNVLRLLDPIGVPGSAFGSTLLPSLTSFGTARGEHAHYSRRAVRTALDPLDEYNRVKNIVNDLHPLEQWLLKYQNSIR
jgi:hypothetical protein